MKLDRPEGEPDQRIGWGSDIAAQMLRRFGIPFISLNPGASYRGLHDSLVNHLGNERPGILLCLHEDHSVAIAHGYARATGEPMACVLHANVGLLHGMMGLFNAWCDRAPMFVLGATGPVAAEKRRPWIDWIHTMRDQGALVRSFVKWDDQPTSPESLVESLARANMLTRSEPTAPVYICLDAGLQEAKLEREPEWPDLARFASPSPSRPAKDALDKAVRLLDSAKRPVILAGRGARTDAAWGCAHTSRRAPRRLRDERFEIGRHVPHRPPGPYRAAIQCAPQAGARNASRGRRDSFARLGRSFRRAETSERRG